MTWWYSLVSLLPFEWAAPGTMRMDKVLFTREVNVDASLEESLLPGGTVSGRS